MPPLSQPSPPQGGKGLIYNRVIASVAKQPRGLTRTASDILLGCFGALRLAMTRGIERPPHPVFHVEAGIQTLSS
jgi:hypothetical protein